MPNDWIPCTKWTKLEGKEEANRRREAHRRTGWFRDNFLLEICHNAGEWFSRYSVRYKDYRTPAPIDPEQFFFETMPERG